MKSFWRSLLSDDNAPDDPGYGQNKSKGLRCQAFLPYHQQDLRIMPDEAIIRHVASWPGLASKLCDNVSFFKAYVYR